VAHDVEVPGRLAAADRRGQRGVLAQPRRLVVGGRRAAPVAPRVQVRQQHAQDRRLHRVQPRVAPDELERRLVARAVEAQHPDLLGQRAVGRRDRAGVAERAEVLRREERERRDGPERAGAAAVGRARAGGLRGVLHDRHAERLDLGHRRDVAEQVHHDHRLRARRQRGAHSLGRDAEGLRVDVAEDGPRAGRRDRLGRRVEGERGNDDLVAGPDAEREQRQGDGVGPVRDADRVRHAEVAGPLLLERGDLRPEDEPPAVDDLRDARGDLVAQRRERCAGVEQRDGHGGGTR
jgi:hypothetical protein